MPHLLKIFEWISSVIFIIRVMWSKMFGLQGDHFKCGSLYNILMIGFGNELYKIFLSNVFYNWGILGSWWGSY